MRRFDAGLRAARRGRWVHASEDQAGFGLELSRESQRALGLDAHGCVRIAGRAGRMLLLEGERPSGPPVPWDRDLVLCADVRSFPLADLLQLVHTTGKSGYLLFQHDEDEKSVYLSRGEVVFASSSLRSDRLGPRLLRSGRLDEEQLEVAERRHDPAQRIGRTLVELGYLTPRELWNAVKSQVEELVRSLFSYSAGWIHFWEGDVEPDNVVRLALPTQQLIEQGLAMRDELLRDLARLEDGRTRIVRVVEGAGRGSENERAMFGAVDGSAGFAALCHRTGLDPRTAARTLQFLERTGQVRIEQRPGAEAEAFTAADDDVVREAVTLYVKLIFELSAPLVALDGPEAVSERLTRVVEESVRSGHGLLDGVRFGDGACLDPTQVEHRALRQPSDRVRTVDEALGEIVAYLEFELKNHPRIPDADPFLEAVDPLRAMLIR